MLTPAEARAVARVKRGEITPGDAAFLRAFEEAFGVAPLVAWEGSAQGVRRPRLMVVLERLAEAQTFRDSAGNVDRAKQARAAELAGRGSGDLLVVFTDFETSAKAEAHLSLTQDELETWAGSLGLGSALWRANRFRGAPVVFTHAAEQATSVTSARLADWSASYLALVGHHDEFGYLTPEDALVRVDSRENLDANYEGSWYYYWL